MTIEKTSRRLSLSISQNRSRDVRWQHIGYWDGLPGRESSTKLTSSFCRRITTPSLERPRILKNGDCCVSGTTDPTTCVIVGLGVFVAGTNGTTSGMGNSCWKFCQSHC